MLQDVGVTIDVLQSVLGIRWFDCTVTGWRPTPARRPWRFATTHSTWTIGG